MTAPEHGTAAPEHGTAAPDRGMAAPRSRLSEWVTGDLRILVDFGRPFDCSRAVRFDGSDPALFGAGPPRAEPFETRGFVGDVNRGGSVNVDRLDLVPHCHGTHTETAGHLSDRPIPIADVFRPGPVLATLATVVPATGPSAQSEAGASFRDGDGVVTDEALGEALGMASGNGLGEALDHADRAFMRGLVIRVRADSSADAPGPVYFSAAAARRLLDLGVEHLVLELPSIDRPDDGGRLAAHRAFWGFEPTGRTPAADRRACTITELASIPADAPDGRYLLDLHLPNLGTDAVPSRPVLYAADDPAWTR